MPIIKGIQAAASFPNLENVLAAKQNIGNMTNEFHHNKN